MKKYFVIILFCQYSFMISQTIQQIDSLTYKMCETLSGLNVIKDDIKFTMITQKHLPSFHKKFNITSQTVADSIGDKVFFRLQKNCKSFLDLLNRLEKNKSDWIILTQKPKSKISKKDYIDFFTGGKYYYKEYDGKLVNVVMTSNSWTETFEDNTTSKLLIHPKNNCEFELEFIESDNKIRKNFSTKGDLYNYGIYQLNENVFDIWTFSKNNNTIYSFRLYRKK